MLDIITWLFLICLVLRVACHFVHTKLSFNLFFSFNLHIEIKQSPPFLIMIRQTRDWAKEIPELHEQGKIYQFYNSKEFRHMRDYILRKHHYECLECKKRGKYTKATVVHHVLHVEDRPDLCLSEFYKDEYGKLHIQLEPVCAACHNLLHPEKLIKGQKKTEGYTNEERW